MKISLCKIARHFAVANLCGLLPLWFILFGGMPERIRVQIRGDGKQPVALAMDGINLTGKDAGVRDGRRVWEFAVRGGVDWDQLELVLPRGMGPESVRRVDVVKWQGLVLRRRGEGLEKTGAGTNGHSFRRPSKVGVRFRSAGWAVAFCSIELVLLGLSIHAAVRRKEEGWKSLILPALGGALALALLFQVVLPVQSYLSNRSAFPFTGAALGGAVLVRFCVALALGTFCLSMTVRHFGRWTLAPVFAFAVCAYLESGVLSFGLPDLKGDWTFFDGSVRNGWDSAVWAGIFVLFFALHPVLKRRWFTVSLCLSALFLSSLLDVKKEAKADASKLIVQSFSPLETVIRSATYSASGNVMVFVIDSLERGVAHGIVEDPVDGEALKAKFRGFTEYLDNVGGANSSLLGIANAFTGDYPETANLFEYYVSEYSPRSALKEYLEKGYDVAMATEALGYGYCTSPAGGTAAAGRFDCFLMPSTAWKAWSLADIDKFRWLPFAAKGAYAKSMDVSVATGVFDSSEERVFGILKDAEVRRSGRRSFLFVHTHGVHPPVTIDRTGAPLATPSNSDEACVEMGIHLMKQLGDLFDAFREKGIYDNSMIVVMADHGPHPNNHPERPLPPNALPFLWIKPVASGQAFQTSLLPTTHAHLADLLRAAAGRTLSQKEIEELMRADQRRYRWIRAGTGPEWKDYLIDREGNVSCREGTLSRPVGEMRPLELSKHYSLDRTEMGKNKLDIVFRNVTFWPSPLLEAGDDAMGFFLRAPDPEKRYALRLVLACPAPAGGGMKLRQTGQAGWTVLPHQRVMHAVLRDLRPAPDGKLEIEGEREGPPAPIWFLDVMLEEEAAPAPEA